MKNTDQRAVRRNIYEIDSSGCEPDSHCDDTDAPCSARIITAIGDPTTAEIFGLYAKHLMRSGMQHPIHLANTFDESGSKPLLTIFITDLRLPQTSRECFRLIRLYLSASYPVVIFFGEPPSINGFWSVLFPDFFRFYRPSPEAFGQMYRDICLINQTILHAQNMPGLTVRGWNCLSALRAFFNKRTTHAFRAFRSKFASPPAGTLIRLRKVVIGFSS